jgi:hypothetical protein
MSGFDGAYADNGDSDQLPVSEMEENAAQQYNMLQAQYNILQAQLAAQEAAAAAAAALRDCTHAVSCAFKRRNVTFLHDIYERYTDDSGWLPARNLAQALTDANAPTIPDSLSSARASIARYNPDTDEHMKFAHFMIAVNEPDELQLWFQDTDEPVLGDALRAIVGRGDGQLRRVSELTPQHLDMATNAIAAAYFEHLLNVQREVRRMLEGPFESAQLR